MDRTKVIQRNGGAVRLCAAERVSVVVALQGILEDVPAVRPRYSELTDDQILDMYHDEMGAEWPPRGMTPCGCPVCLEGRHHRAEVR